MKSQIVEVGSKKVLPFPKLMKSNATNAIVLFYRHKEGQIVNGECHGYKIGFFMNQWNMDFFKDFNGTIKLSNE
jgi:hypothetical protein